jgi:hypothetical protein
MTLIGTNLHHGDTEKNRGRTLPRMYADGHGSGERKLFTAEARRRGEEQKEKLTAEEGG